LITLLLKTFFEGIEERISEIGFNYGSGRKFELESGRKENRREESQNVNSSEETDEPEEIEKDENENENVKTRRMKEDGWKVSQEFWDTRRRFVEKEVDLNRELEQEEEEISEYRFYPKKGEEYRNDGERRSRIRDLIDQVGASIEEIRRKKTHEQKDHHHHMEDEPSLSKRTLYMVGSGSKDLVPISEEVSEEM